MKYQEQFENTYRGKKVLLTGHTGFKGSWMLAWLKQLGAKVKGLALEPENDNDLYNLINGNELCDSVIADIRDRELVSKTINEFQPDFIFHLAAQSLVRRSYEIPAETFEVNVMGTVNVLEAVRNLNGNCTVVIVTTDKVYENREWFYPYRETDRLGGYDAYSASKAASEIAITSYRNCFFSPKDYNKHGKAIASARAGNVIGGGDRSRDRIIPDIVKFIESNSPIPVRNPYSIRPWQHVTEPISGYLLLGVKLAENPVAFSTAWNFGPYNDDVLTVKQLVEKAVGIWGEGSYEVPESTDQLHEAGLLKLDISKTVAQLGWKPKLNSSQAIEKTIDWYKNTCRENAAAYTTEQIIQYQQL